MIPKRKKKLRMGLRESSKITCPSHCRWVRGFEYCVAGKRGVGPLGTGIGTHECEGRMEAHHVRSRGAGGGDEQVVPLCALAHKNLHDGCCFDVDLPAVAADLWKASPHRLKMEQSR
jgi:hypothetical protein